ncbi:hypothetical protein GCM10017608_31500 [Agromyces luteolus]|uniref:Uncharacterized protein n=1 Tax=Agromyces luteolus TaxID=88373 RepID=A0A7C9HIL7_9MICO|nr:hypothetical protein [Agromyces luteolus]MUN07863.1 hypothetical protein [Agromyces luteolus]GLK29214.1 hypothetical protein GCM10017608_31500 [Agromyces luteolus]
MVTLRRLRATVGAMIAAAALAGCSMAGVGFADLERTERSGDELPAAAQATLLDSIDPATSRYIGEDGDLRLWLARGTTPDSVCIVLVEPNGEAGAGCGGAGGVRVGGMGIEGDGELVVQPDGLPVPDGAVVISENVHRT